MNGADIGTVLARLSLDRIGMHFDETQSGCHYVSCILFARYPLPSACRLSQPPGRPSPGGQGIPEGGFIACVS